MVWLPGDNINSYYRTSVTKYCCAPGRVDCAPGLKYFDIPARTTGLSLFSHNMAGKVTIIEIPSANSVAVF